MASLGGAEASAEHRLEIMQAGYHDIGVRLCFPYWDKNAIAVSLDSNAKTFSENRLWWPYWRRLCWLTFEKGVFLAAGAYAVSISGIVCQEFSFTDFRYAASLQSTLLPARRHICCRRVAV